MTIIQPATLDVPKATPPTSFKLCMREPAVLESQLRLPAQHKALLNLWRAPAMLLETLLELELLPEAARLLCYGLPNREAVWWSCMCVEHTASAHLLAPERQALAAAETWVRQPDDARRRDAARAGRTTDRRLPGTWPAIAASWSLPLPGAPTTDQASPNLTPPAFACGRAAETALTLAALRDTPFRRLTRFGHFMDSGRDIAKGGAGRLLRESVL